MCAHIRATASPRAGIAPGLPVAAALPVGIGEDRLPSHLVERDVLRRVIGGAGDRQGGEHRIRIARHPLQHLHPAHRAAQHGEQPRDAQVVDQHLLRTDHVVDGHRREIGAPRARAVVAQAARAGRAHAAAQHVGADDEVAVGVDRPARPHHHVPPAVLAGDRMASRRHTGRRSAHGRPARRWTAPRSVCRRCGRPPSCAAAARRSPASCPSSKVTLGVCSVAASVADVSIPRLHRPGAARSQPAGRLLFARTPASAISAGPVPARMMSSSAPLDAPPAPAASAEEPPPQDGWPGGLAALRAELDRIDDDAARPADAARARGGAGGEVRQAQRVSARARGLDHPPPAASSQRRACRRRRWCASGASCSPARPPCRGRSRWRVCEPRCGAAFTQAAREHFGALTPLHAHRQPGAGDGRGQPRAPPRWPCCRCRRRPSTRRWWTALLQQDEPRVHVVARLPFWAPRAGRRARRPGAGDRHHRA